MFTTTVAAITMSGLLASGAFIPGPSWVSDYSQALHQSADQGRPIAVFIANGSEGYAHVVQDGPMPSDATRILKGKYVCLFVDTSTEAGEETAQSFEMKEGLVISSRGGKLQALRHVGTVAPEKLTGYLTRFSEAGDTVAVTETNAPAPIAPAAPAVISNPFGSSYCPSCRGGR